MNQTKSAGGHARLLPHGRRLGGGALCPPRRPGLFGDHRRGSWAEAAEVTIGECQSTGMNSEPPTGHGVWLAGGSVFVG
ncbi:hypothetical protein BLA60_20570 [Actinophytocola xinjiangensis]|uniref:Uncharacterized protein n=1 Tax=Actinophytocola xinjiangensis TaxID=485602 RepID=A0A7Z0WKU6_9PSEU|nr:hypothetical protein [Actinophytocola xinjiangensis]OLF08992.1 hypothetical protein BLA60_20570 [Actinophytocola xinjiangensis]